MDPITLCRRYMQAWNRREAEAVLACFAPDGSYADPLTRGPIAGDRLRTYVARLWNAFPDLCFVADQSVSASPDRVFVSWTLTGTNAGPMNRVPPTGRQISMAGVKVMEIGPEGIVKVTGYFDAAAVQRQLGMQVIVQPPEVGPVKFGTSTMIRTGERVDAGAIGITEVVARTDDEVAQVKELSRRIAADLVRKPGFINLTTSSVGRRTTTLSSWESVHALRQSLIGNAHAEAMRRFLGSDLAEGGATSVWLMVRTSAFRRCPGCQRMRRLEGRAGTCECGALLETVV
jgi:steroid delta-isomerase-like uncharacterized protein